MTDQKTAPQVSKEIEALVQDLCEHVGIQAVEQIGCIVGNKGHLVAKTPVDARDNLLRAIETLEAENAQLNVVFQAALQWDYSDSDQPVERLSAELTLDDAVQDYLKSHPSSVRITPPSDPTDG